MWPPLLRCWKRGVDLVMGIGGGSVLDVAKLLSVLCVENAPTLEALLGEKPQTRTLTADSHHRGHRFRSHPECHSGYP